MVITHVIQKLICQYLVQLYQSFLCILLNVLHACDCICVVLLP